MQDLHEFLAQFERPTTVGPTPEAPFRLGHRGHDPIDGRSPLSVFASAVLGTGTRPYRVISFFTADNEYADHAERLRASLRHHDIEHELVPIESRGAWEFNCAFKARFVQDRWDASDIPIVWLDADATVETHPTLFSGISADFAAHKWEEWQVGSGTLYFGKSSAASELIKQWVLRCEADPVTWDQIHLHSAWCDIASRAPLRTLWLPRTYLQIFDAAEHAAPVIKHWQASRARKMGGHATGEPEVAITERGREDRRNDRLWRTAEEAFWIAEGVDHIKPELGFEFPEGFDVGAALTEAIGTDWPVLEIGCGVGRIASTFDADRYIGVDVNPFALAQARRRLPAHRLRLVDDGYAYPSAPTALVYTVLLHIADEALTKFLVDTTACRSRFIIAEIMDSRWRRDGNPPVFNRDPEDYTLAMQALGFRLSAARKYPYARYDRPPWNTGRDSRLTILTFDRMAAQTDS